MTIGTAAMGAMTADIRSVASRGIARESALHRALDPVWYGGVLTPVVVEAQAGTAALGNRRVPTPARTVRAPAARIASRRIG